MNSVGSSSVNLMSDGCDARLIDNDFAMSLGLVHDFVEQKTL